MTDSPLLDTAAGALRGRTLPGGGALFAGIPFAAPPVGPLRLRPPQPYRPWSGVRDATRFGPASAQRVSALVAGAPSVPGSDLWAPPAGCGEDCLYLNVWTPDPGGRRPVLVWIHGGGFDSGSAGLPNTDGAALSRLTGAVVVAANYRLGALGYLHLAELGRPGCTNLGLQDQAAALRWVRDHIAAFGGDPGNVTVAGQSAGASSIGALLATPAAAGTFRKAILQSGHTERVVPSATATAIATDLLAALEITDVDELDQVPAEKILQVQNDVVHADVGRRSLPGGRGWGPVLDGTVLPRHPYRAVADGEAAGIGLLVGVNRDEMRLFQAMQGSRYAPADEPALLAEMRSAGVAAPERLLAAYRRRAPEADLTALRTLFLNDAAYRRPAARLAAAGRAHLYLFSGEPQGPVLGASHGVELPLLFDRIDPSVPHWRQLRDELATAWARFAADGDPGWPSYDARAVARQFGGDGGLVSEPPADDVTAEWGCNAG